MTAAAALLVAGSFRKRIDIVVSANALNYVLNTSKASGYLVGNTDVFVTINAGVELGSTNTALAAFTVDTTWHTNDKITITNNGALYGMGGNGGNGGGTSAGRAINNATAGGDGGHAFLAQRPVKFINAGTIKGGGGGGGGGGSAEGFNGSTYNTVVSSGASGAQGYGNSLGGNAGVGPVGGTGVASGGNFAGPATTGNGPSWGNGFGTALSGQPGSGNVWGVAGINGASGTSTTGSNAWPGGAGGAAGRSISGKAFVNDGAGVSGGTIAGPQI